MPAKNKRSAADAGGDDIGSSAIDSGCKEAEEQQRSIERREATKPNFIKVYEYRKDDPDPILAQNPMALVFPPPQSDADLYSALVVDPPARPDDFGTWPLERRKEYLELLDEFHYVFENELDFVRKILALVRKSFRSRNPSNPRVLNAIVRIMAGQEVKTPRLSNVGAGGGLGVLLTGITGVGKSSLLDRLVNHLGDYGRFHQSLNGEPAQWPQLGVIRVTVKSTWKHTLQLILSEIDRQLGRDFYLKRERSASLNRLENAVHEALTAGFAPLVIIDELQRIARLNESEALKILQGLIDMMGDWGVPVLVVGTVRVRLLLELYSAEMDKFSSHGVPDFQPLDEHDRDTSNFILLLKEQSVSLTPISYSPDFDRLLLAHSMGVRRIMREYMRVVLTRHADDENTEANGALLEDISENELRRFQQALSVLRKAKLGIRLSYSDLQAYEDYLPPETEKRRQTSAEFRVESDWRRANQSSLAENDSPELGASAYLTLAEKLLHEEAADRPQVVKRKHGAQEQRVETSEEGRPRAVPKKLRNRLQQSSEKVKTLLKPEPLGAMKPAKENNLDGVDPGELS